ncbi:hypothetical protein C8T65DRAFT_29952 [Cerioporus squamosus]|nr:hypothetical protein C8T65DRAFT_29952 [Cerioporus squamosus]
MSTEPTAWSRWASVATTLSAVKAKVLEFLTAAKSDPRFFDDIVLEIVSYLDPPDAARAARVCRQWRTHATRVAYTHVFLHSETSKSVLLAQTLRGSPLLRGYVRHVTIIHCFPTPANLRIYTSMYGWLEALPEGSLRTFRAVCDDVLDYKLRSEPAVRTCPDLQILDELLGFRGRIIRKGRPHRHTADVAFEESSSPEFSSRFFHNWTSVWSPAHPIAIDVTVVCPAEDPSVHQQQLRALIFRLFSDMSRDVDMFVAIGHQQNTIDADLWSSEVMGLLNSRRTPQCLCTAPVNLPLTQPGIGPAHALAAALLVAGGPLPSSTVETLLDRMGNLAQPPRWARLRIGYHKETAETRGCRECGIFQQSMVRWLPEA